MLYDLWYRVSRTIFPFISFKRYHEICDDYDAVIDRLKDTIDLQAEIIERDRLMLRRRDDFTMSVDGTPDFREIEPIEGKSVTASGVFYATITDEEDIARMDNEGPVNPAQWKKD